jgi:anti-anti-sigma factor
MDITATTTASGRTVLTLSGKVDHDGALQLEAALAPLLTGGRIALDLTDTVYVTSHGFRVLLTAVRAQRGLGGDILLAGLSEPVRNYFDIAGLSAAFEIVATRADIPA